MNSIGEVKLRGHNIPMRSTGKLNSYTSFGINVNMSFDSRNLINRFLQLNRLESSTNHLPHFVDPYQLQPPSIIQRNRNRLTPGDIINKIPDLPITSNMGTELLNDLITRQGEFLKRIRKHPQDLTMRKAEYENEHNKRQFSDN